MKYFCVILCICFNLLRFTTFAQYTDRTVRNHADKEARRNLKHVNLLINEIEDDVRDQRQYTIIPIPYLKNNAPSAHDERHYRYNPQAPILLGKRNKHYTPYNTAYNYNRLVPNNADAYNNRHNYNNPLYNNPLFNNNNDDTWYDYNRINAETNGYKNYAEPNDYRNNAETNYYGNNADANDYRNNVETNEYRNNADESYYRNNAETNDYRNNADANYYRNSDREETNNYRNSRVKAMNEYRNGVIKAVNEYRNSGVKAVMNKNRINPSMYNEKLHRYNMTAIHEESRQPRDHHQNKSNDVYRNAKNIQLEIRIDGKSLGKPHPYTAAYTDFRAPNRNHYQSFENVHEADNIASMSFEMDSEEK